MFVASRAFESRYRTARPLELAERQRRLGAHTKRIRGPEQTQQIVLAAVSVRGACNEKHPDHQQSPAVPSADVPLQSLPPFPEFLLSQLPKHGGKRFGNAAALTGRCSPRTIASVPTTIGGSSEVEWSH